MFQVKFDPLSRPLTAEELAEQLRATSKPEHVEKLANLLSSAPRQSGMEHKHERWIMDVLNFLNGQNIPVWNHDARGTRLPHDKEIPERLGLLTQKIADLYRVNSKTGTQLHEAREKLDVLEGDLLKNRQTIELLREHLEAILRDAGEAQVDDKVKLARVVELATNALEGIKPDPEIRAAAPTPAAADQPDRPGS